MVRAMILDGRVEIRSIARFAESAHPLKECGRAFGRMAVGTNGERVLDDSVDRPTLLAGQFMREVAGFGAANREWRGGHTLKIASYDRKVSAV